MSRLRKILNTILLVIVLIPTCAIIAIQFPFVQTAICNKAAHMLSQRLDGDVQVGKVYLSLPNSVILKDIIVHQGSEGDTLAYVGKVLVHASVASALTDHAHIHRISIEDGFVRLEKLDELIAPIKSVKKKPEVVATVEQDTVRQYESVTLDRLTIKNMALSTLSKKPPKKIIDWDAHPRKVNWQKLGLTDINLDMRHIVWNDTLTARIEDLRAKESRGWDIQEFNADVSMSAHSLHVDNLHYRDGHSDLKAFHAYFDYDQLSDFGKFAQLGVGMDVDFDKTYLDLRSIGYFGGGENLRLRLYLWGRVTGSVGRIHTDNLHVESASRRTKLGVKTHIVGLPFGKETMASVKLDLSTDMPDVAQMVSELSAKRNFDKSGIAHLAPGEKISFKGSLDGLFTDFVAHGGLSSTSAGKADIDIVCQANGESGTVLDGFLETDDLDLGKLLDSEGLGKLTCDAVLNMLTGSGLNINLSELNVSEFGVGGRSFENITASGNIGKKSSDLRITSLDDWVKFSLEAQAENLSLKDMALEVKVDSLKFYDSAAVHDIGPLQLSAASRPDGSFVEMFSDFADIDFESATDISEVIARCKAGDYSHLGSRVDLSVRRIHPLLEVFAPNIFLEPGSNVQFDGLDPYSCSGHLSSGLLAVGNNYFKGISTDFTIDTLNNVSIAFAADTLQSGNTIAGMPDVNFTLLGGDVPGLAADLADSHFHLGDVEWTIGGRRLSLCDGKIGLDSLRISHEDHFIAVDGTLGKDTEDTLALNIHDMRLELFNSLFAGNINLKGSLDGHGELFGFLGSDKGFIADIAGKSLGLGDRSFGDLALDTKWNPEHNWLDLSLTNTLRGRKRLNVEGSYDPAGYLDIVAVLDSLNPGIAEPLLSNVVSNVDGALFGEIHLGGQKDSLRLESLDCHMENLGFKLLYTQVPYTINGPFSLDGEGVHLDGLVLQDAAGNIGTVKGGVLWDNMKDTHIATRISVKDILGLDTKLSDNPQFYGKAYASGDIFIGGKGGGMMLSINATTGKGTSIHIPLSSNNKEHVSILRFVGGDRPVVSSYDSLIFRQKLLSSKSGGNSMNVRLNVAATRDAEIQIEVNRSKGDILKARGDGQIAITAGGGSADSEGNFDIKGDYIVNSGSYKFTLVGGIVSKEFKLDPGGSILMTGDILQSQVDMVAKYSTKASISTLIQDTTASGSRRTVNCGIGITGALSNPELAFSVDIPDLDPSTAGKVESALNNEEKRMKQVLAVLLSGSFVPEQDGGIVNSTTVLYSNVSEIMANQFNNIFHQLDIPLDFGFNYQPTESGTDLFDVAVSTELFNNRVKINGNIGNRQNASTSKSDIVGDVDVEIKLLSSGRLLLNLFSHSADQYSNYLDQSQRTGAGIVYQEEFDTVQELWRKIFWSKKRREEEESKQKESYERR